MTQSEWPDSVVQQVYEIALSLLESLECLLSSDPDMPSHDETTQTAETRIKAAKKYFREEDL